MLFSYAKIKIMWIIEMWMQLCITLQKPNTPRHPKWDWIRWWVEQVSTLETRTTNTESLGKTGRFSGIAGGKYTADDHSVCKEPAGGLAPPRVWLPASPAAEERKTSPEPDNISLICAHLFIYLRFWCLIITDKDVSSSPCPVSQILHQK